jgi:hypothetical protein
LEFFRIEPTRDAPAEAIVVREGADENDVDRSARAHVGARDRADRARQRERKRT